jgi:translation initiation factor 5
MVVFTCTDVCCSLQKLGKVEDDEDDDDDVDWGEDVSEAAVQARRLQELSGAVSSMVVTEDLEKTPSERVDIFYAYVKVTFRSATH